MAHLHLILYAPPNVHKDFMTKVNQWRYEVEGKHRKGMMAPFVSEVKFYDVRLPEDMIGRFARDLHISNVPDLLHNISRLHGKKKWMFKLASWIFNKINFYNPVTMAKGEREHNLGSHNNFFCLGNLTDDINSNIVTGERREVL